jgi:DEAD/DEAH box helicase domain-containing protein
MSEVYYDVETQKSAEEVGGWNNVHLLLVSVAVTWCQEDGFKRWVEGEMAALIEYLNKFDRNVSFNGDRFDSKVLSHYGDVSQIRKRSFDIAPPLFNKLGHRIKLDTLAQATLGTGKTADGMVALQWWREGEIDQLAEYCEQDVKVLVGIVKFARENGYVQYFDLDGRRRSVYVKWQ